MTTAAIHGISGMFCRCLDVTDRWWAEERTIHNPAKKWDEKNDGPRELRHKCTPPMNQPHTNDQRQANPEPKGDKNDCERAMLCEGLENVHERDGSNEN
jgi:hypothetical protein